MAIIYAKVKHISYGGIVGEFKVDFDTSGIDIGDAKVTIKTAPQVPGGLVFVINGQLNTYNSTQFQAIANDAMKKGYTKLIADCNSLNYISSTGVGAFTFILKEIKPYNGKIILSGISPKIMEIFQLLGFSSFFDFTSSVSEAVEILKEKKPVIPSTPIPIMTAETLEPTFPLVVACPTCSKKFKITKASKYRCGSCQKVFAVAPNGKAYAQI